jgi:hypothetical protein
MARRSDEAALESLVPSGPSGMEKQMYFRYRLYWPDGAEAGEAEYIERVKPDEIVWTRGGLKLRVLSLVEEDGELYTGLLMVELA